MYNKDNIWGVVFTANDTKFQIVKSGEENRASICNLGGSGRTRCANWSVNMVIESLNKEWWTPLHPLIKSSLYEIY